MRVFLLSAGYGKRLLPLTKNTPKCLIKLNKKPLLQIWLEKLEAQGVRHFLINTHYKSDKVEKFIKKTKFSKKVKLVYEKKILGTGGTLYKNLDFFKQEDEGSSRLSNGMLLFNNFTNINRNQFS